jgi:hypothetical protein
MIEVETDIFDRAWWRTYAKASNEEADGCVS